MEFALHGDDTWRAAGERVVFRWIPPDVPYGVVAPWPGTGRFDCGVATLYFSHSAEGALAEFFRRHPELLTCHAGVNVGLVRLRVVCDVDCMDVSLQDKAAVVGMSGERLRSSDARRPEGFSECQVLALAVVNDGGCSILS